MQFSFVTYCFFLNSRFLSLERQMNICIMSQYKKNTNFEATGINLNIKPSVNSFLSCMSLAV